MLAPLKYVHAVLKRYLTLFETFVHAHTVEGARPCSPTKKCCRYNSKFLIGRRDLKKHSLHMRSSERAYALEIPRQMLNRRCFSDSRIRGFSIGVVHLSSSIALSSRASQLVRWLTTLPVTKLWKSGTLS